MDRVQSWFYVKWIAASVAKTGLGFMIADFLHASQGTSLMHLCKKSSCSLSNERKLNWLKLIGIRNSLTLGRRVCFFSLYCMLIYKTENVALVIHRSCWNRPSFDNPPLMFNLKVFLYAHCQVAFGNFEGTFLRSLPPCYKILTNLALVFETSLSTYGLILMDRRGVNE